MIKELTEEKALLKDNDIDVLLLIKTEA